MAKKATKKGASATPVQNAELRSEVKAVRKETVAAPVQSAESRNDVKTAKKETVITPARSTVCHTEEKAVKKETAPVRSAQRPAETKAAETKVEVYLQFGGKEVRVDEIMKAAREDFHGKESKATLQSVQLYMKPEEFTAYYVANGAFSGKVAL